MDLNERKLKILEAIICDYLETAEPVGSRTISKKFDLGISSATIRNEMADLEELGFIVQPHTSAGRIPSDKGYRLYVDNLLDYTYANIEQLQIFQRIILEKVDKIETLLQELGKVLSITTNYTTMISSPQIKKTKLKYIQLIPLDEQSVILVTVTDGNIVKNHIINTSAPKNQETLYKLSNMLNKQLQGLTLEQINLPLIQNLKQQMGIHSELLNSILDAVAETIQSVDETEVYTSGTTNILDFPEFKELAKAKAIFNTLEEKDVLISILSPKPYKEKIKNVRITIGDENSIREIKECSVITAMYKIGEDTVGTIGILGPTRMDYAKVVSTLSYLVNNMNKVLKGISGG